MRLNLPVTDKEYIFADDEFLVSKTDLKGRITYCNRVFVNISGFSEQELLGQPHNLVRHPDMPQAAFADLWDTVHDGREWHGVVKNRCKDGGFYWVDATVTPSFGSNGEIIGFMSVRRRPSAQQVADASALYQQMKQGEESSTGSDS